MITWWFTYFSSFAQFSSTKSADCFGAFICITPQNKSILQRCFSLLLKQIVGQVLQKANIAIMNQACATCGHNEFSMDRIFFWMIHVVMIINVIMLTKLYSHSLPGNAQIIKKYFARVRAYLHVKRFCRVLTDFSPHNVECGLNSRAKCGVM